MCLPPTRPSVRWANLPTPHLLCLDLTLTSQPWPQYQYPGSTITPTVARINSQIHSVILASHVSTHFSCTCQLISIITLIIHHFFTPGSKPTFSTNSSHLNTPSTLDCFHDHRTRPDLSRFSIYF